MRKTAMVFTLLMLCGIAWSHPLHLSFSNLEFNDKEQRWELIVKIFWDDLEDSVKERTGVDLGLTSGKVHPEAFDIMKGWLTDRLVIHFNQQAIDSDAWISQGWELKEEAVWMRFAFRYDRTVRRVRIRNTILFDYFSDQKNLLIFTQGKHQKAYQFKHGKPEVQFSL